MLAQKALVTKVYNDSVDVQYDVNSSCSGCASEDNCGVGTVAKAFSGKTQTTRLDTSLVLSVGQWVTLETNEDNLLLAACITYMLPLFGLIMTSVIGQYILVELLSMPNYSAIFFGIIGGVLAQRFGRYWLSTYTKKQPKMVIQSGNFSQ